MLKVTVTQNCLSAAVEENQPRTRLVVSVAASCHVTGLGIGMEVVSVIVVDGGREDCGLQVRIHSGSNIPMEGGGGAIIN